MLLLVLLVVLSGCSGSSSSSAEPTTVPVPTREPEPTTEPEPATELEPTTGPVPTREPEPTTEPIPTATPEGEAHQPSASPSLVFGWSVDDDPTLTPVEFEVVDVEPDDVDSPAGGVAARFDGTSSRVMVADHDTVDVERLQPSDELTVEFWFRADPAAIADATAYLARWRWYGWGVRISDGQLAADVWHLPDGGEPAQTTLAGGAVDGEWHHLALVVDDSAVRLYLDGEIVDEGARLGPVYYLGIAPEDDCCGAGGALGFGRDADVDGSYFAGWIDAVALHDRALDAATIAAHAAGR